MNARKPKPGMSGVFKCSACSAATVSSLNTNVLAQREPRNAYVFVIYGKSTCGGQIESTNETAISYAIGFEKVSSSVFQCDHKT